MTGYRQIHTKIWKDAWFLELEPDEKLLFIYLFSNERTNLIGLYDLPIKVMAFETGLEKTFIVEALQRFASAGKVVCDDGRVWVVNMVPYNAYNLLSPKIQANIRACLKDIPDCPLKRRCVEHYNSIVHPRYHIDMTSIPFRHEQEQEQQQEQTVGPAEPDGSHPSADDLTPPSAAQAAPAPVFQQWFKQLRDSKNKAATLRGMFCSLYPNHDPPDYPYIGKIARDVGGAGRLLELLWQESTRPPTGDVLAYCVTIAKRGGNGHDAATSGRHPGDRGSRTPVKWASRESPDGEDPNSAFRRAAERQARERAGADADGQGCLPDVRGSPVGAPGDQAG